MLLTKEHFSDIDSVLESTYKFINDFDLWGYDLDKLDEIEGDYDNHIDFLYHLRKIEYDENNKKIKINYDEKHYTDFIYDDNGLLIREEFNTIEPTEIISHSKCFEYDTKNRLIKSYLLSDNPSQNCVHYMYNDKNQLVLKTIISDCDIRYWIVFKYQNDKMVGEYDSYGNNKKFIYDDNGLLIMEINNYFTTKYKYVDSVLSEKQVQYKTIKTHFKYIKSKTDFKVITNNKCILKIPLSYKNIKKL